MGPRTKLFYLENMWFEMSFKRIYPKQGRDYMMQEHRHVCSTQYMLDMWTRDFLKNYLYVNPLNIFPKILHLYNINLVLFLLLIFYI